MEPKESARGGLGAALAVFGYGLGSLLAIGGLFSLGYQLVVVPIGLGLISIAALRQQPRLALAVLGALLGISAASLLSILLGLAETFFLPHPFVLVGCVAVLGLLGHLAGRWIESAS